MEPKYFIYALHLDCSNRVYVGKTTKGLLRIQQHTFDSCLSKSPRRPIINWIKRHKRIGHHISNVILEEHVSADGLDEAERFYIAYFRSIGMRLLNVTDGGDSPPVRRGFKETKTHRFRQSIATITRSTESYRSMMSSILSRPKTRREREALRTPKRFYLEDWKSRGISPLVMRAWRMELGLSCRAAIAILGVNRTLYQRFEEMAGVA